MAAIYDLTGHPQLDEAVVEAGPEYLDYQTLIAEATLGVASPRFEGEALEPALELARTALVIQVNWQENTGADARMLSGSSRAGVSFRSEGKSGLLPLADPQARIVWARAVAMAVSAGWVADGATPEPTGVTGHDPSAWNTVHTRRPIA
jgi:hypothetical protein